MLMKRSAVFLAVFAALLVLSVAEECKFSVSKGSKTNKECRDLCSGNSDDFKKYCEKAGFVIQNGQAVTSGDCWGNYIHGFEDHKTTDGETSPGEVVGTFDNPGDCQDKCHASKDCSFFVWRAITGGNDKAGTCLLKPKELVDGAEEGKAAYCHPAKLAGCKDGSADCADCKKGTSCVWKSTNHVTGPKYCDGSNKKKGCASIGSNSAVGLAASAALGLALAAVVL